MKKFIILSLVALVAATSVCAQDDLYFSPKKKLTKEERAAMKRSRLEGIAGTYYCGSKRNVDEYNRRGAFASHYEVVENDSLGSDIISFEPGDGSYPDSICTDSVPMKRKQRRYDYDDDEDYRYSRRMMVYDGFIGPYWDLGPYWSFSVFNRPWRSSYWTEWNNPWCWYDPWYYDDPYYWNRPWIWNNPWCWNGMHHWGYGYPVYMVGAAHRVNAGTSNHGKLSHGRGYSSGARSVAHIMQRESNVRGQIYNKVVSKTGNFSGWRGDRSSESRSYSPTRSSSFSGSRSSGSSFSGGSHSGGSFSGGASRGGGGNFTGRR